MQNSATQVNMNYKRHQEWGIRHRDRLWIFYVLFALGGILLAGLDPWLLPPDQVAVLGLVLFATALASYGLGRIEERLSAIGLITGALVAVLLTITWLQGAYALFVLPVTLATIILGWRAGCILSAVVSGLLILQPFNVLVGGNSGENAVAVFLINASWWVGWFHESAHEAMFVQLFGYYQRAQGLLEEARDQRLTLNQANEDLAEAYRQVTRLNELLRASQAEIEATRRTKEAFVANVSHELRTPLNMIIGFSEMILNAPGTYNKLPNPLLADMSVIYRNSQHLAQLINDVLDLSQIEASQWALSRDWIDIGEIVREATQAVEPLYLTKGLTLNVDLPAPTPTVYCDHLRTRQILLNLLSNAGRFTRVGGVQVTAHCQTNYVIISVADSGPGIAREDQKRIFEPFQQLDTSTRRLHDGSGLGLSISKRLVELHGGKMWLESTPNIGSTFSFSLPRYADPTETTAVTRWFNPYSTYTPRTRRPVFELPRPKPQILVLERADVLGHQINTYLDDVEVVSVQTVAALKLALASTTPGAILVNDPRVMDDWGLIRRKMELPARTPVISCYVPGTVEACEHLHVVNYLVKPVTRDILLTTVAQIAHAKATLLVVEDSPEMAHLIARQLASADQGYRILRASDGRRALELLRENRPDAMLLDLGLPDQDGYQVLQAKNADPQLRTIPVIIISARDPLGEPVVTNRLRVEMVDGLSVRDIILSVTAINQALSPLKRLKEPV